MTAAARAARTGLSTGATVNESARYDLVVIAAGLLLILGGLVALRTGKAVLGSRPRWDLAGDRDAECKHGPIRFWVHVALYFAIGGALVAYGANGLLMR